MMILLSSVFLKVRQEYLAVPQMGDFYHSLAVLVSEFDHIQEYEPQGLLQHLWVGLPFL